MLQRPGAIGNPVTYECLWGSVFGSRAGKRSERPDFVTYMLSSGADDTNGVSGSGAKGAPLSHEEIEGTFTLLVMAGGETVATALSTITHELVQAPHILRELEREVRGAFQKEEDITMAAVRNLPLLNACIEEGLRLKVGPLSAPSGFRAE